MVEITTNFNYLELERNRTETGNDVNLIMCSSVIVCASTFYMRQSVSTDPGGLEVERSFGVRKVAGSIPSCDIPKVVKR